MINVKAFGAVGNGVHDDTIAIQSAINSLQLANSNSGGILYFPCGQYYFTSLVIAVKSVNFQGESSGNGTDSGVTLLWHPPGGAHAIDVLASGFMMENMAIRAASQPTSAYFLIHFHLLTTSHWLQDCNFYDGYSQFFVQSQQSTFERCQFLSSTAESDANNVLFMGAYSDPAYAAIVATFGIAASRMGLPPQPVRRHFLCKMRLLLLSLTMSRSK